MVDQKEYFCKKCGKKISKDEGEGYEGMYWERRDDELTEESDMMFDELM
jgi:hypothetical protein